MSLVLPNITTGYRPTGQDMQTLLDNLSALMYAPAACGISSTIISVANVTTTIVPLDVEYFDLDGMHSTVSPNTARLTIRTAGMYDFLGSAGWAFNNSGYRQTAIFINGVVAAQAVRVPVVAGGGTIVQVRHTAYLNVGDYVDLRIAQASGGALSTSVVFRQCFLQAHRLADST